MLPKRVKKSSPHLLQLKADQLSQNNVIINSTKFPDTVRFSGSLNAATGNKIPPPRSVKTHELSQNVITIKNTKYPDTVKTVLIV
jgi:hypothetical protein